MTSIQPRSNTDAQGSSPTSVYRYYDGYGVLIYAGITRQGMARNLQHNGYAEWWQYVARQEVEHFPDRKSAAAREKELIRHFRPPFNKQHNLGHAEIRQAYLDFISVEVPDEKPYQQYLRLGKVMPLDVAEFAPEAHRLVLRTQLRHGVLASGLRLSQPTVLLAGRRSGWVNEIVNVGPFAYLHCQTNKNCPDDLGPIRAIVGWQQDKKPHHPFLKKVLAGADAVSLIANLAVSL